MVAREPEPGFRYWAFISYSHQDHAWGRWLARALETYRIPQRLVGQPIVAGTIPARLTPVFRDRDELPTATDLDRTVAEALRQSWCLIVICSPASAQSRWVNEEVREFQRLGGGERIHCLIVDGGNSGATPAPCFPPALSERPWSSAAPGEPIAADARRSGDGKAAARMKLIAGILGISYDKLVQRDHQRGYRRMAMIAAAAVLALAVLTTFTIITITSRRDAEAQRSHAEGLVEFMLGDLRTRLAPEGRLATLDAVGKEALGYYAAQDPAMLDADALARRARALLLIGEVYDQRGRLDDALKVFREAATSTAELLLRAPDDAKRIFDHAQSVFYVGQVAWRRGEIARAEPAFREYMALAERLVAIDPTNADWQAEIGYANINLGNLLLGEERADEAAQRFERALEVAAALVHHSPGNVQRRLMLAQAHAWLASARVGQGRLRDAVDERNAEVGLYQDLLAADPRNLDAKDGMLVAERDLGNLALMRGDASLAEAQARRALALADVLLAADPDNTRAIDQAAGAHIDLADALFEQGEIEHARSEAERARALASGLVARDPSVVGWQVRMSASLLLLARIDGNTDPLETLRRIQGALQRLEDLRGTDQTDARVRLLHAQARLMAGNCQAALGSLDQARTAWADVITELQRDGVAGGPWSAALLSAAHTRLGQEAQATTLRARLQAIGYHHDLTVCAGKAQTSLAGLPGNHPTPRRNP